MTFVVSPFIVAIVLLLVRALLTVAFARESILKLKDIRAFAKNDGVPVPLALVVAIAELAAALSFATGVIAQWAGLGVMAGSTGALLAAAFTVFRKRDV